MTVLSVSHQSLHGPKSKKSFSKTKCRQFCKSDLNSFEYTKYHDAISLDSNLHKLMWNQSTFTEKFRETIHLLGKCRIFIMLGWMEKFRETVSLLQYIIMVFKVLIFREIKAWHSWQFLYQNVKESIWLSSSSSSFPVTVIQLWTLSRYSCVYLGSRIQEF